MTIKEDTEKTILAMTGVTASAFAIVGSIYLWDQPTELAFHAPPGSAWFQLAEAIGTLGLPFPYVGIAILSVLFWFVILVSTRFVIVERIVPYRAMFVLFSAIAPWLIARGLQAVIGRSRPELFFSHGIYVFRPFDFSADYSSFPSAHAAVAAAMATTLSLFLPDYRITFFPMAIMVALSRIAAGHHYLSDTIAGIMLGIAIAAALERIFARAGIDVRRVRPQWPSPTI